MIDIGYKTNPPDLIGILNDLPGYLSGPMTEAAAVYLIGNEMRGLKHYVQYRYITRVAAYGQTFKSDAQRRKVMGMIRRGEILPGYPRRTGKTQRGWTVVQQGRNSRILNPETGAFYTVGDPGQSRHEELVGWRRYGLIVASNERGMIQAAEQEAARVIRAKGL